MNAMLQPRFAGKSTTRRGPRAASSSTAMPSSCRAGAREAPAAPAARHAEGGVRQVPLHRTRMQAAGMEPRDLRSLDDLGRLPFTLKSDLRDHYLFGPRAPARRARAPACVLGHDRQADGGRLHRARHRDLGEPDGALARLRRRAPGRRGAQRLRVRPFHRRPGRALRRRAPRRDGRADVGRRDRAPGAADPGFPRTRAVRDAFVCAQHRGSVRARRRRAARRHARDRDFRRRALERGDAPRDRGAPRHQGARHLRPVRDHGSRRSGGMRSAGRPARLGGPLHLRDHRPGHRARASRRPVGRARRQHAHQAGAAHDPLPHARYHAPHARAAPAAARTRASSASPGATTTC